MLYYRYNSNSELWDRYPALETRKKTQQNPRKIVLQHLPGRYSVRFPVHKEIKLNTPHTKDFYKYMLTIKDNILLLRPQNPFRFCRKVRDLVNSSLFLTLIFLTNFLAAVNFFSHFPISPMWNEGNQCCLLKRRAVPGVFWALAACALLSPGRKTAPSHTRFSL